MGFQCSVYGYSTIVHERTRLTCWPFDVQVDAKDAPTPRSGHRMVISGMVVPCSSAADKVFNHNGFVWHFLFRQSYKSADVHVPHAGNNLFVFGGYFDNGKAAPKFFADVHVFDLEQRRWLKVVVQKSVMTPSPRSACQVWFRRRLGPY